MTPSLLYCPACGAANAPDHAACFACKQPLALQITTNEQTALLHNRYQLLSQLGMGGFGAVYKALDTGGQNRPVAVKQINLRGLTPQEVIEATDGFNREVQMLSQLSHEHLPRIHAHFTDPEHWYVVMDFIDGETLEHYLRDITSSKENAIRALALDEILDIGLQLCNVLAYLHSRQPPIIFRDLKPSNIMRTSRGQLYLIDFGTARYFKPGQTKDTIPLGSPGYAAPEQYGRAQTTPRSDIYSLGALLHHLISRQDPSETPFAFAPLPAYGPMGMSELEALITRMVHLDAEQRPTDIAAVEAELVRIRDLRAAAEPRIWKPIPGQIHPLPALAKGAYLSPQMRQQVQAVAARKKRTRRKFLAGGLAVAGSVALGGVSSWRYWHPARLALDAGFPWQPPVSHNAVSAIAWSPDGQYVAFGMIDGSIMTQRLLRGNGSYIATSFTTFSSGQGTPRLLKLLSWSPDNAQLISVSQDGQLQVWSPGDPQGFTLATGEGKIQYAAWSPDGRRVAAVDDQNVLNVFDASSGAMLLNNRSWSGENMLIWSPDGTQIAIENIASPSSNINSLGIWNVNAGQRTTSISLSTETVTTLAWSPDGQYLAALNIDGTLQVWDIHNADKQIFSFMLTTQQNQLAWSPDSRFLAAIDDANNVLVLDRSSGNTLVSAPITDPLGRGGAYPGRALTWLQDSGDIAVANNNMEIWLWNLPWF